MVLQIEPLGTIGMQDNLMYALSKFRILVRHEHYPEPAVLRRPVISPVICAVNAAGRNGHIHALAVGGVEHNRVQRETSVAGHPAVAVRMIEQTSNQRPGLTRV